MKNFIEVTTAEGKRLININSINYIKETKDGITLIVVTATGLHGISSHIKAEESYEVIKILIQESL